MDTPKKLASIAIVAILIVAACVVLSTYGGNDAEVSERTFIDMQGNEVTVPGNIESVAITSQTPMVPVYIYYMNGTDTLKGANSAGLTYAKNGVMGKIYDLNGIDTSFVSGSTVNIESLISLNPDVVIYTGNRTDEHTMLDNANLVNVGFNTAMTGGNSTDPFETIESWMDQLDKMFGDSSRGDALVEYNNSAKKLVSDRIGNLSENEMPTAMIIFSINSDGTVKVAGDGQYSEYWLKNTGAKNVASGLTGLKDVSMEQIILWNPDYIFFANSTGKMPSDIIDGKIQGQDWSSITAVKNKSVYVFPSATYFSYAPSLEAGVTLQFLAKVMHPDKFADLDLESVASDYFKKLFDYDASSEDIDKFLYPDEISVRLH